MRERITRALNNEAGNAMMSNLVGAVVMLGESGAVATGIAGMLTLQGEVNGRNAVTKEISLVDSVLRADILWASVITATDDSTVAMTTPGRDGRCKVNTWQIRAVDGKTVVDSTVVNYTGIDAAVNPVRCTGTASSPTTQTLIADASPSSAFSSTNPGGRRMLYSAGTPSLGRAATPPTAVDTKT
jgi:hypothetical protein